MLQRWTEWFEAIHNRDCAETDSCQKRDEEIRSIQGFRDQLNALNPDLPEHLALVDPLWNEIKSQFPKDEHLLIRKELLECIKLLGMVYAGDGKDLLKLYKSFQTKRGLLLKLSEPAGIQGGIQVADVVEFLLGSQRYRGFEEHFKYYWHGNVDSLYDMLESKASSAWYVHEMKILQEMLNRRGANENKVAKLINYYKLLSPQTIVALGKQEHVGAQLLSKYPAARKAVFNALIRANMKMDIRWFNVGTRAEVRLYVFGRPVDLVYWKDGKYHRRYAYNDLGDEHVSFDINKGDYLGVIIHPIRESAKFKVRFELSPDTDTSTLSVTEIFQSQRGELYPANQPAIKYMSEYKEGKYIYGYFDFTYNRYKPDRYLVYVSVDGLLRREFPEHTCALGGDNCSYGLYLPNGRTTIIYVYYIYGESVSTPLIYEYKSRNPLD
ncbi:hypothetical protein SY83_13270 [Paenibacillus swuensis]|uniref:Uncharacterized protein n=1 Tax=Paenibacillus swuensis TaxID=1178515 RepID=A0A172TJC9_9BACL|nr:hypothetical protein [Paenibacillus swuensis]ANE47072.1 hypothetical protein SY83_13270 [Paenibacillus swuensis]